MGGSLFTTMHVVYPTWWCGVCVTCHRYVLRLPPPAASQRLSSFSLLQAAAYHCQALVSVYRGNCVPKLPTTVPPTSAPSTARGCGKEVAGSGRQWEAARGVWCVVRVRGNMPRHLAGSALFPKAPAQRVREREIVTTEE